MPILPNGLIALSKALKTYLDTESDGSTAFIDRVGGRFYDSAMPGDTDLPSPYATYTLDKDEPIRIMGGRQEPETIPFTVTLWSREPSKQEVLELGALLHYRLDRSKPDMSDGSYVCHLVYEVQCPEVRRVNPFWRLTTRYVAFCYPDE